jgi:sec-independent protein translocase protein TatA
MLLGSIFPHIIAFGTPGTTELIIIFGIIILLFGASRLPSLARSMGKSIKEFKKASKDIREEIETAGEDDDYSPRRERDNETLND